MATTTIGDKSYCPIVSLLTRYADFSSCYFTPSIRTHSFRHQEYVFETIIEYLAIRLAHVLFPRQRNQTNTNTLTAANTEEVEEVKILSISNQTPKDTLVVLHAPVYMYIEMMNMLGDQTTIKRRKFNKKNIYTYPKNYQQIQKKQVICMQEEEEEELQQNCTILDNAATSSASDDNMQSPKQIVDLQSAGNGMRKVRFNLQPEVHVMCTWSFAYQAARKGDWHFYAVDRSRFQLRCQRASLYLNPILTPEHRNKIYMSRFADNE